MIPRKKLSTLIATLTVALFCAGQAGAQEAEKPVSEFLNPAAWTAFKNLNYKFKPNPDGITSVGGALEFDGYHPSPSGTISGNEAQYSLNSELSKKFENKQVEITFTFNGEFATLDNPTNSAILISLRATNPAYILTAQPNYTLVVTENSVFIHKYAKGTDPNFQKKYLDFPALGFPTLPKGKDIKVTFGVINETSYPRIIVKINDVEIFNALDNKNGLTVKSGPESRLMIGLFGTNRETPGKLESGSNIVISNIEAK